MSTIPGKESLNKNEDPFLDQDKFSFDVPNIWLSKRLAMAILLHFGFISMMSLDASISIAVVEMTRNKTSVVGNETVYHAADFDWDSRMKGLILSIDTWGIILCTVFRFFAKRLGGVTTFGTSMLAAALLTMLIPVFIYLNFYLFLMDRLLVGAFQYVAFISTLEIWVKWAPDVERSRLIAIGFSGIYTGFTVAFPISGFCANQWGWVATFYATGGFAFVWSVSWLMLVRNDPAADKLISKTELIYLKRVLQLTPNKKMNIPWKEILTSKPFWAYMFGKFAYGAVTCVSISFLPSYIKDATDMNVNDIGVISAIPSTASAITTIIGGHIIDHLRNSVLTTNQVLKLFFFIGFIGGALLLNCTTFTADFTLCITFIVLYNISLAFNFLIIQSIPIYMAPDYPSILTNIAEYAHAVGTVLGKMFVGFMVTNHTHWDWCKSFMALGILMVLSGVLFLKFGSCDMQWSAERSIKPKEVIADEITVLNGL